MVYFQMDNTLWLFSDKFSLSVHRSPESQFPIPLYDCVDALHYVGCLRAYCTEWRLTTFKVMGIDSLSFDRKRLIIGGTSAGASLACGVFQLLREECGTSIRGLVLNSKNHDGFH